MKCLQWVQFSGCYDLLTCHRAGGNETEQDHMILAPPPPRPRTMSSACLLPVENFNQRVSLIKEVRNTETKENSLRRLNNNNVVIKHSQGLLVLSQGP